MWHLEVPIYKSRASLTIHRLDSVGSTGCLGGTTLIISLKR